MSDVVEIECIVWKIMFSLYHNIIFHMFVVIHANKQKSPSGTLECFPLRKDLKALIMIFIWSVFWNFRV